MHRPHTADNDNDTRKRFLCHSCLPKQSGQKPFCCDMAYTIYFATVLLLGLKLAATPQPLHSTVHYNIVLNITFLEDGPQKYIEYTDGNFFT